MAKNIVICADGTGNLGGETPDSNVFKMYKAVDIHDPENPQITFYDNGVGTADNKYWRGLSGAFGFGFKRNVCDLYKFLAQNYHEGDNVFLFGFSRGAAEVRAFSGFINACGLVNGTGFTHNDLESVVGEAFNAYKVYRENPSVARNFKMNRPSFGSIPIKVLGVWDTVSALGWPQDWCLTGPVTFLLNGIFSFLDWTSDKLLPHRFYNYELTPNIEYAFHALAIDDERKSFTPKVWDENLPVVLDENSKTRKITIGHVTTIEQVWFVGAHSNVGGGYGRAGLANVPLDWMMTRAGRHGLKFKTDAHEKIQRNSNFRGRLYDSRDGIAIFYRYQPRDIEKLCWNAEQDRTRLCGKVKIHSSVIARMEKTTANYAPGHLPYEFSVVDTPIESVEQARTAAPTKENWETSRKEVDKWVAKRKSLYGIFLTCALVVFLFSLWLWISPPIPPDSLTVHGLAAWFHGGIRHVADVLTYFLPKFFDGLITLAVRKYPIILAGTVAFLYILWRLKESYYRNNVTACEVARKMILANLPQSLLSPTPTEQGLVGASRPDVTCPVTTGKPDEIKPSRRGT